MVVGTHPTLSNPTHVSDLPPCLGTLEQLARFGCEMLKEAVRLGVLTPDITRKDASQLHTLIARAKNPANDSPDSDQDTEPDDDSQDDAEPEPVRYRTTAIIKAIRDKVFGSEVDTYRFHTDGMATISLKNGQLFRVAVEEVDTARPEVRGVSTNSGPTQPA
jgi:hypothetical protein